MKFDTKFWTLAVFLIYIAMLCAIIGVSWHFAAKYW